MSSIDVRHEIASGIAGRAGMEENIIPAGMFNLTTWEHVRKLGAPANIYIEGDGIAWVNKYTVSTNPTPSNPIALRLAGADRSDNVIYIARPCQYSGWNRGGACPELYWTTGVAAPEVIAAYQQALGDIKERYNIQSFNLIGYSGGAAIAVLVAGMRTDVTSIRTVAGNTDYDTFTSIHNVTPIKDSLRPTTAAMRLSATPQRHFIGGKDKVVTPEIFEAWKKASADSPCVHGFTVPSNTHEEGWTEMWPALLATPLSCSYR